jgi:hypothetical protein
MQAWHWYEQGSELAERANSVAVQGSKKEKNVIFFGQPILND